MSKHHDEQTSSNIIDLVSLQPPAAQGIEPVLPLEPEEAKVSKEVSARPLSQDDSTMIPSMSNTSRISPGSSRSSSVSDNQAIGPNMPLASDLLHESSRRHGSPDHLTMTPSMSEALNTVSNMPDMLVPPDSGRPTPSSPAEENSDDPTTSLNPYKHGPDQFSHKFQRYGPSPFLEVERSDGRVDNFMGHATWVCSGEVISKDDRRLKQWMSSSALHLLGSKLSTLLCGRQPTDLTSS